MNISDDQIRKVLDEKCEYEMEVQNHNMNLILPLHKNALKYFNQMLDGCFCNGKIEKVGKPSGDKQNEEFGIFKEIHVDQWAVGTEGDSFNGHIYARVKNQWYKIPYYC